MKKYLCKFIDIFSKNNRERLFCAFLTHLFLLTGIYTVEAQSRSKSYENYIEQYCKIAVEHRKKYGIPASITLAQGLLESGAGQSRLAREANNHFGIKCGNSWNGKSIKHDDDKKKECFRKYKKAEESYDDHSKFLKRKRYEPLFKYKVTDYESWAKGLRKCGYATDKNYADKLIKIIKDYKLYRFDSDDNGDIVRDADVPKKSKVEKGRTVYYRGKLKYVLSAKGESYESIANQFGIKKEKLLSFNDVKIEEKPLKEGSIIYLQKKQKKYDGKGKYYEVKTGETAYSISQKLGIQLNQLLKQNKLKEDALLSPGDVLKVK